MRAEEKNVVHKMLNSDLPIEKAEDDILNRSAFSESLAKAMFNYTAEEGFVIGIYGKWGSGKTSVINMVLEQVESMAVKEIQKPIMLKFNPWLCSDPKQLISQFFRQLSSTIRKYKPKIKNICGYMNDYAELFELAGYIPKLGILASFLGKSRSRKADKKNNDFQSIKDEIISNLRKEKIKLIITIDDIDRLSSEEIISLFQLVKSLADFPNTVYLLAFDREVVIKALEDVQKGNGAEYLEKIIQVPFELPSPNVDDIYKVFSNKINAIVGYVTEEKWDNEYWNYLFYYGIKNYLHTIRDVARYINTFALKYSSLKNEINIIDLIGLTCIQVFEPEVYSKLPFYKECLCGDSTDENKIRRAYSAIISNVSDSKSENMKNILNLIFPNLNIIFHGTLYFHRNYNNHTALVGCCVSNSDFFERYFSLYIDSTEISNQALGHLLFTATKEEAQIGIMEIILSKNIKKFLCYIKASFNLKESKPEYSERAKILLECLILNWDKLEENKNINYLWMSFDFYCTCPLLNIIDKSDRYGIIHALFTNPMVDMSAITSLLLCFEHQHNRFTDYKYYESEALLLLSEVLELEKIFVERVVCEINSGELVKNRYAAYALSLLEHIDVNKAEAYTKDLIKSDLYLAKFISFAVSRSSVSGSTVYIVWNIEKKNKERINKYIDINDAYNRINAFIYSDEYVSLDVEMQEDIVAFLVFVDKNMVYGDILISDIKNKLDQIKSGM